MEKFVSNMFNYYIERIPLNLIQPINFRFVREVWVDGVQDLHDEKAQGRTKIDMFLQGLVKILGSWAQCEVKRS